MKKSLLALAVLGAFASAASAQSSVTVYGKIDGGEGSGTRACLDERRPAAVDNENRSRHQPAALCSPSSWKN